MRPSFGGLFMIRLFIVFIFIYVAFAAISLNYAKAFRLKNSIISFIEENEIIDLIQSYFSKYEDQLKAILANAGYNKTCSSINETEGPTKENGKTNKYCIGGVVIERIGLPSDEIIPGTNSKIVTYEVTTYADWNMGVLNKILVLGGKKENSENRINGGWTITGKAKVVARG